jgi:hypothetical protein
MQLPKIEHQRGKSRSYHYDGMINLGGSVFKASANIFSFEVRVILKNFCFAAAAGQHVENVFDANTHTTNAGTTTALTWIGSDATEKAAHVCNTRKT